VVLRLGPPLVSMMAGRINAVGVNLFMSLPSYIEQAYNHFPLIFSVPLLNLKRPTMFLNMACREQHTLDFVWNSAVYFSGNARVTGLSYTAARQDKRYFRSSAIGITHFINYLAELMRLNITMLIPDPVLRGLPQAPPPITAVVAAR